MSLLVSTLITGAQELSDKENDASITSTTWTRWVNFDVEALWKLLVTLDPTLYRTSGDFTLAGGYSASTFDLSTLTRFRAVLGVEFQPDTSSRREIRRRNFQNRDRGRAGGIWANYYGLDLSDREYDVSGNTMTIYPPESSVGSYRVYFRQGPYLFTSSADTTPLDAVLEPHAEIIMLRSARRGLGREESGYDEINQRLAELTQEITDQYERDSAGSDSIGDVIGDGSWTWP